MKPDPAGTGLPAAAATTLRPRWAITSRNNALGFGTFLALWALGPFVFSDYWLQIITTTAIYSVVAAGLGILMGRVGLFSLGQIALLAVGAWFALRIGYLDIVPFPVLLLLAGLITAVVGIVIGLPALRLDGLYLALITLMAAAVVTLVLTAVGLPNGGTGLLGFDASAPTKSVVERPDWLTSVADYFRFTFLVVLLMFGLAAAHVRGRPRRAWATIRQSHAAALATGINVSLYKMWAFALAAFMTGVAGGLLAASAGGVSIYQFPVQQSIMLVAAVMISGAGRFWGAVVAAFFMQFMAAIMNMLHVPSEFLTIMFGFGVMQTLLGSPEGVVEQMPKDLKRLGGFIGRTVLRRPGKAAAA